MSTYADPTADPTAAVPGPEVTDVEAVVVEVWASLLGPEEPVLPWQHESFATGWAASVTITGAWEGTVVLELTAELAEDATRTMLDLATDHAPDDADVADAVGELVNMVGGNVKSLMPEPSLLSLPVVAAGRVAHPSDAVEVVRCDLLHAGRPLRVSVHAHHA